MRHRVKTHKWIDGILQTRNHIFDTEIEAKKFINDHDRFYMAKRYNSEGRLVESLVRNINEHKTIHTCETYA